jgi:hypothetical protein
LDSEVGKKVRLYRTAGRARGLLVRVSPNHPVLVGLLLPIVGHVRARVVLKLPRVVVRTATHFGRELALERLELGLLGDRSLLQQLVVLS